VILWLWACAAPHECWQGAIRQGPWPAPLPSGSVDCGADGWERRACALARAGAFLADQGELRFDAAIGVSEVVAIVTDSRWQEALAEARSSAARDPDHPLRRAFDPAFRVAPGVTTSWTAPGPGERIPFNRVTAEALHCPEHGWRPETEAYTCGAMRDAGYGTTHALWALQLARAAGCTQAPCAAELASELSAWLASPWPEPAPLAEVDLRAEAAVMLLREGVAASEAVEHLLALQGPDGGWGLPQDDAPLRYHATVLAAWAIALEARGAR
jgi:hypothetical protein